MYESFYGFREKPFSLLPDPDFLYLGGRYSTALSLLEYGVFNQAGFILITGEPGTGKTTLLRKIVAETKAQFSVGVIANTHPTMGAIMPWILLAFGLSAKGKDQIEQFHDFSEYIIQQATAGRRAILIVDEAQNLAPSMLEEFRLLSNVNLEKIQALQVLLFGQPRLRELLQQSDLIQFAQRVAVDYRLGPMDEAATIGYVRHRVAVAGGSATLFTEPACRMLYRLTGGVPRLINQVCDMALAYGFSEQADRITDRLVDEAAQDRRAGGVLPLVGEIAASQPKPPGVVATGPGPASRAAEAPAFDMTGIELEMTADAPPLNPAPAPPPVTTFRAPEPAREREATAPTVHASAPTPAPAGPKAGGAGPSRPPVPEVSELLDTLSDLQATMTATLRQKQPQSPETAKLSPAEGLRVAETPQLQERAMPEPHVPGPAIQAERAPVWQDREALESPRSETAQPAMGTPHVEPQPIPAATASPSPKTPTPPAGVVREPAASLVPPPESVRQEADSVSPPPGPVRQKADSRPETKSVGAAEVAHSDGGVMDRPPEAVQLLDRALELRKSGQLKEALRLLREAAQHPALQFQAHAQMGLCYRKAGRLPDAIAAFQVALAESGESGREVAGVRYALGRCYEELGNFYEALDCYRQVSRVDPGFRDVASRIDRLSDDDEVTLGSEPSILDRIWQRLNQPLGRSR